jgi:hypothetical protein
MIPRTTTQKVAVNTVRMVSQQVVTRRPVTVYRSVPLGTSVATYAVPHGTATALAPVPEPGFREAQKREEGVRGDGVPVPRRKQGNNDDFQGDNDEPEQFKKSDTTIIPQRNMDFTQKIPAPAIAAKDFRMAGYRSVGGTQSTAARVGQWIARRTTTPPAIAAPQGPAFPAHMVAMLGEK